jgi:hypothetical protein
MSKVPFGNLQHIFDFEHWKKVIGEIIWMIVSTPIKWWLTVPWYVKVPIYILLIILGLWIIYWTIRHKDDIYRVVP